MKKRGLDVCVFTIEGLCLTWIFTTVFFDVLLWKTKHLWKRLQKICQSCLLSTDRIEIHQSQALVWPWDLLSIMVAGCDWCISIQSVDNMHDWRKFWKRSRGCFVFKSHVSPKTLVRSSWYCFKACSTEHESLW